MTDKLTAALLVIGNEILSGRTQDTNTPWIAGKLNLRGIRLIEVRVVPDVEECIVEAVNELRSRAAYLFTTGGIGPTHDDITTESIAKAFGVGAIVNEEARLALLNHYRNEADLTPARMKMAHIPDGATLIPNPVSGAPGFQIGNVYVMAGVPRIMQAMLDHILPELEKGHPILSNTVTCDLPESVVAEGLTAIQNKYDSVEIGSYPHFRMGELGLSVVLRSTENNQLHEATQDVVSLIDKVGGKAFAVSVQSNPS
ncbi:MAG TPA: molybdopterin-binding protein [Alphaproteobacteria bacterium]|nr:molybdopterin-binding protein [Alphaproteobacteria bacterium]HNS45003.1 molybdopterin-binding protein [Alphaproteobacteria bacterium]